MGLKSLMEGMGYKLHPDHNNCYYKWVNTDARISFIFNYSYNIAHGYLAYLNVIADDSDVHKINTALKIIEMDSETLSKNGWKIRDVR